MKKQAVTRLACQRGFTLAEVLVTSVLMVLVLLPIYTVFAAGRNTYNRGMSKAEIQQDARLALDWMTREARMAGYESPNLANPACPTPKTALCALPTKLPARIGLRGDVDGDDTTEEVEYELQNCVNQICDLVRRERGWDGATSTWSAWSADEMIAGNVEALTFTYIPAITNPTRVRLQVDVREPNTGPDMAFVVVSEMELRNL
jgi:prepilin-type N-terminal cleavage/methylation domain-containing protein